MKASRVHNVVRFITRVHPALWMIGGAIIALLGAVSFLGWYGYTSIKTLQARSSALEMYMASSTALLQESISEVAALLGEELEGERARLAELQERIGAFQHEVGQISSNVSDLDKLTRTDEELLQKYSRVFFLNEHYAPSDVVEIPAELRYSEQRRSTIHTEVYPHLESMLKAAAADGLKIYVSSAYRPFDEQEALNDQYTVVYGAGTANQFSADQGYSEHQLGTTVDLITTGLGGSLRGFEKTEAYTWMLANAHRYGFTLSYPEGNAHYIFEPWHWRYVGIPLATKLHTEGKHFYDLDQRVIDEYLVHLFE